MSLTLSTDLAASLVDASAKLSTAKEAADTATPSQPTPTEPTADGPTPEDVSPFNMKEPGPADDDAEVIPSPSSVISDLFKATIKKKAT